MTGIASAVSQVVSHPESTSEISSMPPQRAENTQFHPAKLSRTVSHPTQGYQRPWEQKAAVGISGRVTTS